MAEAPVSALEFIPRCPDCARREVRNLPRPLPDVGDDFDWRTRDFDGFRLFMMEELAARVPERRRFTAADLEVVLVEALAAVLDQLSDMADRVSAEAYLETARRPESVRRLLAFIGHDAARAAVAAGQLTPGPDAESRLERLWQTSPHLMEASRAAGPREIHVQQRMVTVDDYGSELEEHPLVRRANGFVEWGGAWPLVRVAVLAANDLVLDQGGIAGAISSDLRAIVDSFHLARGVPPPVWDPATTLREVLSAYVAAYRMVGQEVILEDAVPVGISMSISVRVDDDYFQSEVRDAVDQALGRGPGGFFEPGRLRFGEDVRASDILHLLMSLDGVSTVCLNRFKRVGGRFLDQVASGRIVLAGAEIASCDNDDAHPERGYYNLQLHGGRRG